MSYRAFTVICAASLVVLAAGDFELPAGIKTCKRDSSDYSSCLRLALQESWPIIVAGIPELDLPPLDPYFVATSDGTYDEGQLRGKISVKNVNTYGMAKSRFLAVRAHHTDDHFHLEVDLEWDKLFMDGDYKANAQLGSFRLGGQGYFNISMEDVKTTWGLDGSVANDRWTVEHFKIMPDVGKMKVYFSDMFNGNEELNKAAMSFINEFWPTIYRGMLQYLAQAWDGLLTDVSNRIFSKVPFSKIFP
ncbi:hypothetical protein KM043_017712 [Ampulex compressa]|uniref:Haemolymph juvenile hormone binding protein n=1 Tax=Ampulex compressa TaxID=860918 RepID=A0A1W6EW46_AMPCP|nr:haemolymph juvenile hormone binding protein [Ampulex compressa]KAG7200235.1 hypothetical protein KM043_017712 [Ampulex compressa]